MKLLEICCYHLAAALIAQEAGAHRVELCADPADGGTTPSLGLVKSARKKLQIPLYPIVRARAGDFLFSDEEFGIMVQDVKHFKQAGCDGVVIGILHPDGTIHKSKCSQLVETAYPMGVTFHRAFDWTANPFEALEDIIEIGCERILTSGQQPTALQGAALIADLIRQAEDRIIIMPGSGVRAHSLADLASKTGAAEFHSSASTRKSSEMEFINASMADEPFTIIPDAREIEFMLRILQEAEKPKSLS